MGFWHNSKHQRFSVHTRSENQFKNAVLTGQFKFVLEDNSIVFVKFRFQNAIRPKDKENGGRRFQIHLL